MLKTAAFALAALALSAGAASASTFAIVDHNASVRMFHANGAPSVNFVAAGQHVMIVGAWGNWYRLQIPGQDGWVRSTALDFAPYYGGGAPGGSFCVSGSGASFCINASY